MAGTKISALSAASALAGTEVAPVVQSAATVKATINQIKTYCSASPTLVTPTLGVALATSLAIGGATIGTHALAAVGTAAHLVGANAWTIPSLDAPGYLPPVARFGSQSTSFQGLTIGTCSSAGNCSINFMASAGTLAAPSEQSGAGMALNFLNYVGGAVADWRTFAVIEAGNRGAAPTAEAHVLGRIQLGACNGGVAVRPGVVVYNDSVTVTDKIPLRLYNIDHANVFDGVSGNYERLEARWTPSGTATAIIGTAKGGTGAARNLHIQVGNLPIAEFNSGTGLMLPSDYIFGWSSAVGVLGTTFSAPDIRLYRAAAKILRLDDGASAGAALQFTEQTAPAGAANNARIYAQDNGSGKTQLMVIFGSGAAQQIAIEP